MTKLNTTCCYVRNHGKKPLGLSIPICKLRRHLCYKVMRINSVTSTKYPTDWIAHKNMVGTSQRFLPIGIGPCHQGVPAEFGSPFVGEPGEGAPPGAGNQDPQDACLLPLSLPPGFYFRGRLKSLLLQYWTINHCQLRREVSLQGIIIPGLSILYVSFMFECIFNNHILLWWSEKWPTFCVWHLYCLMYLQEKSYLHI